MTQQSNDATSPEEKAKEYGVLHCWEPLSRSRSNGHGRGLSETAVADIEMRYASALSEAYTSGYHEALSDREALEAKVASLEAEKEALVNAVQRLEDMAIEALRAVYKWKSRADGAANDLSNVELCWRGEEEPLLKITLSKIRALKVAQKEKE